MATPQFTAAVERLRAIFKKASLATGTIPGQLESVDFRSLDVLRDRYGLVTPTNILANLSEYVTYVEERAYGGKGYNLNGPLAVPSKVGLPAKGTSTYGNPNALPLFYAGLGVAALLALYLAVRK